MEKKYFKGLCLVIAIMVIHLFITPGYSQDKPPFNRLTISSYEVGGGAYINTSSLGEGIFKKFGIRVRSVPVGIGTSRILHVRLGKADFGVTIDGLFASEGVYDFASLDWGPQPLSMIYIPARQSAYSFAVAGNSGMKTISDVKGKRVGWLIGSPFTQNMVRGSLAFGGLSLDDVELVKIRSMGAIYQSLLDGKIDVAAVDSSGSAAYELASSHKGIHWIPFPKDNIEGWKRFRLINPQVQAIYSKFGAGLKEKPESVATVPFPQYFAYADANEDKIYWITKVIVESFDNYKDISMPMQWYKLEDAIKSYSVLPYHPGSVRYFKETGVWNEQLEKNQKELLERQKKLKALWDVVIDEALDKGIKGKEFPKYWEEKRSKLFPEFWVETPVN